MMIKKHIPNSITLINLILGFIAILINDAFLSPLLIIGCGVADFLDGFAARILKVKSELGQQLDSLSDLLSFGVAPAFLYYHHVMPEGWISIGLISLVPAFAALRLAIFNLDDTQQVDFSGLATPANGFFFAFMVYSWESIPQSLEMDWIIYLIPLFFSMLMILPVKMFSLKGFGQRIKREKYILILLFVIGIVLFVFFQLESIPLIVISYILLSWINNIWRLSTGN
jgi:CDP-diacylglycerol--serine O-phosphatidyltransferase